MHIGNPLATIASLFLSNKSAERNDAISSRNYDLAVREFEERLLEKKRLEKEAEPFKKLERFRAKIPLPDEREEYQKWLQEGVLSPTMLAALIAGLSESGFQSEEEDAAPVHIRGYQPRNNLSALGAVAANALPMGMGANQYNPNAALGFLNQGLYNQLPYRPMHQYSQANTQLPASMYMFMNSLGGMGSPFGY